MKREDVIRLMDDMPDEVDIETLLYRLYLLYKIDRAEAAIAVGDIIPHEEVMRMLNRWVLGIDSLK